MPRLTREGRDRGRFSFVVVVDTAAVVVFVRSAVEVLRCVSVVKGRVNICVSRNWLRGRAVFCLDLCCGSVIFLVFGAHLDYYFFFKVDDALCLLPFLPFLALWF